MDTISQQQAQPTQLPDFKVTEQERTTVLNSIIIKLNENYIFSDIAKKMALLLQENRVNHVYKVVPLINAFYHFQNPSEVRLVFF